MKFSSVATAVWLTAVTVFIVAFLITGGTPPAVVFLCVAAMLVWVIGGNWVLAKSRARRGCPDSLVGSFEDLLHLNIRDLLLLMLFSGIGGILFIVGTLLMPSNGA